MIQIFKTRKRLFIGFLFLLFLGFSTITSVDYSPLESQEYYKKSKDVLSTVEWARDDTSQIYAGWAKANITPDFPCKVIGFGKRATSTEVLDSLYVRSIVFQQGNKKYLYLSYDLMIVHPLLTRNLEEKLKSKNLSFDGIYYSATHTHNGIGGFGENIAGWLALGGNDPKVIDFLLDQTIVSIFTSIENSTVVEAYSSNATTSKMVNNRLDRENGTVDSTLSMFLLRNQLGKVACLLSFSAHATSLPRDLSKISSDYPGKLVSLVEQFGEVDFALFSAGGVGSHEPNLSKLDIETKNNYSKFLSYCCIEGLRSKSFQKIERLEYKEIDLPLREPHFKIFKYWRLRSWLFKLAFGEGRGKLSFLLVGNTCFVGTPCDFSGELVLEIKKELKNKNLNVILTSFNGEYLGYITPDKYYNLSKYEVQDTNWFGPYNGQYFKESILAVLNKIE